MNDQELVDAQLALEAESRALGASRYRQKRAAPWQAAMDEGVDEASLPPGRRLLRLALRPTAEAIRGFLNGVAKRRAGRKHTAAPLIAEAEPEALAYLTLRCGIQCAVQSQRLQRTAIMIADAIRGHLQASRFEAINPAGAAGLQRSLNGRARVSGKRLKLIEGIYEDSGAALNWSQQESLLVGSKLLELAAESTGLFEIVLEQEGSGKRRRKRYEVRLTEVAEDWLERQHARCELLDPLPLPMVVEPRPWTTPRNGGYLQPPYGNTIIRTRSRPYLEELANAELGDVYNALNAIQSVPWRVNGEVLDVMRRAWEGGGRLGGLPPRDDDPLPAKPADFGTDEEAARRWKQSASKVHAENARRLSKRMTAMQKMWVAEKLRDFPAIYFPHNLDWRGRVYPIPAGGPHPQDGDVGRALLEFTESVPVGERGGRWLAIHLANLFGVDKVSFDERVAWVAANEAAILDSADDPLDGQRFWTTANKPWQALAACIEWAGYRSLGAEFGSRLPIAMDGSNSGLQHFTALLRDEAAAPLVNLVPTERPGDIYAEVARKAQAIVDASEAPEARAWTGGKVTRSIAKRPCMTFAFAATRYGMVEQIEQALALLDAEAAEQGRPPYLHGHENWRSASWLAGVLYKVIREAVPAAKRAMDWLGKVADVVSEAGIPIWWETPAGLPVMQREVESRAERINVTFRGRKLQLQLQDDAGPVSLAEMLDNGPDITMDKRRARNGIAPNYIHSLDAAHLMVVTRETSRRGIRALAVIHDSFGTHAAHTDTLAAILRDTFVRQYEASPLEKLRAEVMDQLARYPELQKRIPSVPPTGTLDLGEVRRATYMFA